MNGLRLAISFLTTIPVKMDAYAPGYWNGAALWFPVIGVVMGGVLTAVAFLGLQLFPPLLAAALVVAAWAYLSGALHLDGLADCCDGLWTMKSVEQRINIMREPQLGAFGVTGLVLFLILKVTAVAAILQTGWATLAFVCAAAFARWCILPTARQPNARPGGMGDDFSQNLHPSTIYLSLMLPVLLLLLGGWHGLLGGLLALIVGLMLVRFAKKQLGGVTGDVFGLVVEAVELAVLLGFAASL